MKRDDGRVGPLRDPRDTTFALVSGRMMLADGSVLDSRQQTRDAATARAVSRALTATPEWWSAVSSIVLPTLDDDEGGYALLSGARTIARAAIDGGIRRSSLATVLRGGVGKAQVQRSDPGVSLPAGYRQLAVLRNSQGVHMGALGIADDERKVCWRILEGTEFYLRLVAGVINARVLVDATGTLVSSVHGMVDLGSLSVEFTEPKADAGHPLVILPDTVEMRELVDALLANSEAAPPEKTSAIVSALGSAVSPRDPADSMKLAVLRADCSVTGLCRRGRWDGAAELEAARVLLLTRFDLRLGIWDLALNPALRSSVLDPVPTPSPHGQSLEAPTAARERAVRDAESARARRQATKNAIANIVASLQPYLGKVGWIVDDYGRLSRPLTEPLAVWPDAERRSLVVLRLEINKASTRIVVWQSLYNVLDLRSFVNDRREAFERVASLPSAPATKSSVQLWSTTNGWRDGDATWSSIGQEIVECTKDWTALLADFVRSCRAVRRARFAGT